MEITEIVKSSFMSGFAATEINLATAAVCFLWSIIISGYVFAIYKALKRNSFYNKSFALSLIVIAVIVSSIILVIQSNIVISLGMVGALSIVRYRTAIKDSLDLVFLFWTISIGLICGAGFAGIAILSSAIITVILLVFDRAAAYIAPKVLVVNGNSADIGDKIIECLKEDTEYFDVKARNLKQGYTDMAIEIKTRKESQLMEDIMKINGVENVSIVAHNGDVTY